MELILNTIKDFFQRSPATFAELVVSLTLVGLLLILVNAFSHYLREWITQKLNRDKEKSELVQKNLKPLLNATSGLVSRIVEIIIHYQPTTIKDIQRYDPNNLAERIKRIYNDEDTMNRHESTAYRLVLFLSLLKYFQTKTSEIVLYPLLDSLQEFTEHKIPVGLRGNLYRFKLLSTQVQERMSSLFDFDGNPRPSDFSLSHFRELLNKSQNTQKVFKLALDYFNIHIGPLRDHETVAPTSKEWKHLLAVCHATVYLMDFFQDYDQNSQWEEYRVYLVRVIKEWNEHNAKKSYLYHIDDLRSTNYLDTYPDSVLIGFPLWRRVILFGWTKRRAKYLALRRRGKLFAKRHHKKKIVPRGVRIYTGGARPYCLPWDQELDKLYSGVMNYLTTERQIILS